MKTFGSQLNTKTLIPSAVVLVLVVSGLAWLIYEQQTHLAIDQAKRMAQAISKQVLAERQVYTEHVVNKLKKESIGAIPQDLKNFRVVAGGIPYPASFVHATSEIVNAQGLYSIDLLSLWNINPSKGARTPFERSALEALVQNPTVDKDVVVGDGDKARYYMVTADTATTEACVNCHNTLAQSPKHDFQLGDVMGGIVISLPLDKEFAAVRKNTFQLFVGALLSLVATVLLITAIQWAIVNRPLIQSLSELEKVADRISMGELEEPVTVEEASGEVGRLAKAIERMRVSLQAAMDHIDK